VTRKPIPFDKYAQRGAYHWLESDRDSSQYNPPLEARYEILLRHMPPAARVLDVGCGDGFLLGRVGPRCQTAVGVDSESAALHWATLKLRPVSNCRVVHASCYELPFPAESFDVVLLADVIEHLHDANRCLAEIGRVLTPHGTLLLTTPRWRPDRKWDSLHVIEYRPDQLTACLRRRFARTALTYFWPLRWHQVYATRLGWKLVRLFARHFYNPFLRSGGDWRHFGQILAVCQEPRRP
jgi:SAM-dependent methyltransferase